MLRFGSRFTGTILSTAFLAASTIAGQVPHNPAHNHKISDDAAAKDANEVVPVIIQYKTDPGAREEQLIAAHGGELHRTMHSIHAHSAHLRQSELAALAADPNVAYISIDRPLAARDSSPAPTNCVTQPEFTT